ncbi:MAG: hypothetical protein UX04_C0005G0004 [Microgenomates group bacterium GW2011_GWF2_45_18]|nr:MAG: hypothetical protein UW18_C0007G0004 [Microgenomates group bacterium GW2011_GWF1_44_10]KKU01585.1 MAG: hypothetical protein UX04_C0005G0004 [Microgenomates group bacterium GW2011_GWF2_45_18]OGJ41330.1 MAG: hypothetical protein A2378_03570 [Candidatus Pacebacteria bacterium RIFOXYB1_FULL_44_10]
MKKLSTKNSHTKRIYFDANAIIPIFLAEIQTERHVQVMRVIEDAMNDSSLLFVTPLCVDEVLYSMFRFFRSTNTLHAQAIDEIFEKLSALLAMEFFQYESATSSVSDIQTIHSYMTLYNLQPRDAFHLLNYKKLKCDAFFTFDTDFDVAQKHGAIKLY